MTATANDADKAQRGYELALALNIKITEFVHRTGLAKCSGSLPLVCLGLHTLTVSLRPWAIPQHPAGEILHRMVVGSIAVASVPYTKLTQAKCDEIYRTLRKHIDAINATTSAVTDTLVDATPIEYAFLRRVLSVLTLHGVTLVPHSCSDTEPVTDDSGFRSRCGSLVSVRTDANAKALGIHAHSDSLHAEVPTTFVA